MLTIRTKVVAACVAGATALFVATAARGDTMVLLPDDTGAHDEHQMATPVYRATTVSTVRDNPYQHDGDVTYLFNGDSVWRQTDFGMDDFFGAVASVRSLSCTAYASGTHGDVPDQNTWLQVGILLYDEAHGEMRATWTSPIQLNEPPIPEVGVYSGYTVTVTKHRDGAPITQRDLLDGQCAIRTARSPQNGGFFWSEARVTHVRMVVDYTPAN